MTDHDWSTITGLPDPALGGTFDYAGDFDRLLPSWDDATFACWRFIDPEGDTFFNCLQMPVFIEELDRLLPQAKPGPERNGMLRLRTMAEFSLLRPHQYLVFVGD